MIGIINIKNRKYTLADIIESSNSNNIITIENFNNIGKCFNGDMVELSDDLKSIKKVIKSNINNKVISGILVIKSKYKYGYNKRGIEIFQFKPFDKYYPIFYVASKVKKKLLKNKEIIINQYCTIKFLNWNNKSPKGEIVQMVGPINDINNKYNILLHKYDLYKSKLKFKLEKNFDNDLFIELCKDKYDDLTNSGLEFYSIDPFGCKDIDDVLSHDIKNNRIGIHISDVSTYIRYFELDNIISDRHTSIYLPNRQINMIPDILATDICSLHPGKRKLVFTIWLYYKNNEIIETKIEKNIIESTKAYTYDEADITFKTKQIFKLSKEFGKKYLNYINKKWTTHEMVEVFMILANHYVAKFLIFNQDKLKGNIPIMRIHKEKIKKIEYKNIDDKMQKMVNILNSNKAEYITSDLVEDNKYYHFGLDMYYYTHFTSPIRREVDIHVHNLLNMIINNENFIHYKPNCDHINNVNSKIKKLEREINKIKILEHLEYCEDNTFEAYIFDIRESKDKSIHMVLYFPSFKILYDVEIINNQLLNMLDIKLDEKSILIKNKLTLNKLEYKRFSLIELKLYKLLDQEIINLGIFINDIDLILK